MSLSSCQQGGPPGREHDLGVCGFLLRAGRCACLEGAYALQATRRVPRAERISPARWSSVEILMARGTVAELRPTDHEAERLRVDQGLDLVVVTLKPSDTNTTAMRYMCTAMERVSR